MRPQAAAAPRFLRPVSGGTRYLFSPSSMTDVKKYQFNLTPGQSAGKPGFGGWGAPASPTVRPAVSVPALNRTDLPEDAAQCLARGNTWLQNGQLEDALRAYDRAIALKPDQLESHFNRGNVLLRLQRQSEALAAFERAIAISPELAMAHYNRATLLSAAGRTDEARQGYERTLALDPTFIQARFNLGALLLAQGDLPQALACMDAVIAHAPNVPQAHLTRGTALLKMKRLPEAIQSLDRALALNAQYPEALSNRGSARLGLRQYDAAEADLTAAIRFNPQQVESYHLLGNLLSETGRHEEALAAYQRGYDLNPALPSALTNLLGEMAAVNDWHWMDEGLAKLTTAIQRGDSRIHPFRTLALLDSPELQLACARQMVASEYPGGAKAAPAVGRSTSRKIRVGYYSADFHEHATAYLMAELFERHDRSQFEWFGFSYGPVSHDPMRARLRKSFDQFLDVRDRSDSDVAALSRQLGIDIAVDLKGFTRDNRLGIFAQRCAPVQVSYLGYPGTTGADYMDYVIGDKTVLPPSLYPHFTEKPVLLPHSYQVNDSQRRIADRVFTREEVGLPAQGFVFCCFNNNYKILPATFDSWMRVLQAVPGSALWLFEDNAGAARRLKEQAQRRGVDPARLVFAPRLPLDEHLARHRLADLFLDTLPCNAHTTTSDALWAGLPVLTQLGNAFAGRVAASLLRAVGLPELVTTTPAEYEARAIELAKDANQLQALRQRLQANRASSPLFNATLFARHIEAAYLAMDERQLQGLPPQAIEIPSRAGA